MELKPRTSPKIRTAKTIRGKRLLKAAETDNYLIQDRSSKLEII